ncbi:MAG: hypothetical protein ACRD3G_25150 [Vicinamibacterales bacterium]
MLDTPASLTLEFGNRSGSWTALALFVVMFGLLGWSVTGAIRQRSRATSRTAARAIGTLLFVGPLLLLWTSSLGGFYVAETDGRILRLHSLLPGIRTEILLKEIALMQARPSHRGRWRLHLVSASGRRYESATWHRDAVEQSTARLKRVHAAGLVPGRDLLVH